MDFNLIEKNFPEVKRFAISKLAGILYGCVEWKGKDSRQDTDWFTAEEYINQKVGKGYIQHLTEKYLMFSTYSKLREENQDLPEIGTETIHNYLILSGYPELKEKYKTLPENLKGIINDYVRSYGEFKKINEIVSNLSDEKITSLIQGMDEKQAKGNQDLFLGRDIWEVYQHIKGTNILSAKGYGKCN